MILRQSMLGKTSIHTTNKFHKRLRRYRLNWKRFLACEARERVCVCGNEILFHFILFFRHRPHR